MDTIVTVSGADHSWTCEGALRYDAQTKQWRPEFVCTNTTSALRTMMMCTARRTSDDTITADDDEIPLPSAKRRRVSSPHVDVAPSQAQTSKLPSCWPLCSRPCPASVWTLSHILCCWAPASYHATGRHCGLHRKCVLKLGHVRLVTESSWLYRAWCDAFSVVTSDLTNTSVDAWFAWHESAHEPVIPSPRGEICSQIMRHMHEAPTDILSDLTSASAPPTMRRTMQATRGMRTIAWIAPAAPATIAHDWFLTDGMPVGCDPVDMHFPPPPMYAKTNKAGDPLLFWYDPRMLILPVNAEDASSIDDGDESFVVDRNAFAWIAKPQRNQLLRIWKRKDANLWAQTLASVQKCNPTSIDVELETALRLWANSSSSSDAYPEGICVVGTAPVAWQVDTQRALERSNYRVSLPTVAVKRFLVQSPSKSSNCKTRCNVRSDISVRKDAPSVESPVWYHASAARPRGSGTDIAATRKPVAISDRPTSQSHSLPAARKHSKATHGDSDDDYAFPSMDIDDDGDGEDEEDSIQSNPDDSESDNERNMEGINRRSRSAEVGEDADYVHGDSGSDGIGGYDDSDDYGDSDVENADDDDREAYDDSPGDGDDAEDDGL